MFRVSLAIIFTNATRRQIMMIKMNRTKLSLGNEQLRRSNYQEAMYNYLSAIGESAKIDELICINIKYIVNKYRGKKGEINIEDIWENKFFDQLKYDAKKETHKYEAQSATLNGNKVIGITFTVQEYENFKLNAYNFVAKNHYDTLKINKMDFFNLYVAILYCAIWSSDIIIVAESKKNINLKDYLAKQVAHDVIDIISEIMKEPRIDLLIRKLGHFNIREAIPGYFLGPFECVDQYTSVITPSAPLATKQEDYTIISKNTIDLKKNGEKINPQSYSPDPAYKFQSEFAVNIIKKSDTELDKDKVKINAARELTHFIESGDKLEFNSKSQVVKVSVIVVLFNQAGLSYKCLCHLSESIDIDYQLIIIDNASTDNTNELIQRISGAKIIRMEENIGFLRAVNIASSHAEGEFIVLLNNDAMVAQDALSISVRRMKFNPNAGAVSGMIQLWNGLLQEAGSIIWSDGSCAGYGRNSSPEDSEFQFVRNVDYCSGAYLMIRRELFLSLGGLDDDFAPAYYEETDLCVRIIKAGYEIVYDPLIKIKHFEFASEVSPGWAVNLQKRNQNIFLLKHKEFLLNQRPANSNIYTARQRTPKGKKNILVIDDRVPMPWLGQGYPRAAEIVKSLVSEGHNVTHYPLQIPSDSYADISASLPDVVEVMREHGTCKLRDFLTSRKGYFNVIFVSRPHNIKAVSDIIEIDVTLLNGVKIIYDAEAVFAIREFVKQELEGNFISDITRRKMIADEVALSKYADVVTTVSRSEAELFLTNDKNNVHVLGHGITVKENNIGYECRTNFLFVGALTQDRTPNSDSIEWFISSVWPIIKSKLGEGIKLNLVGACDAPFIKIIKSDDILLHGIVPDLKEFFNSCRVFIAPTRFAAGVPHKVHEAAANGLPIVSSTLIAEQLLWQDIIPNTSDPEVFAQECVKLYTDKNHWINQQQKIREAVSRDCSPNNFNETLKAIIMRPDSPAMKMIKPNSDDVVSDSDRVANLWGINARDKENNFQQWRHWSAHPVTSAEINKAISGNSSVGWMQYLKESRFVRPKQKGLSIGCGNGSVVIDAVARNVVDFMVGVDLSPVAIDIAKSKAAALNFHDKTRFEVCDVNAWRINEKFDLIIFEQSLHHVSSLDRVLMMCRDALTDSGFLVINEYVGPDRFQWSDHVENLMNDLMDILPTRLRMHPDTGVLKPLMNRIDPQAVIDLDPSEAIHSADILPSISRYFDCIEVKNFGGTLLQFLLSDIAVNFNPNKDEDVALLRMMSLFERHLTKIGHIESNFVYGVYRSNNNSSGNASLLNSD